MSSLSQMGMSAAHIASQNGGFEPQRASNGLLYISGLSSFGFAGPSNILALSQVTAKIPTSRNDAIILKHLNTSRKVPGPQEVDEFEATYYDYIDKPTLAVLENWRNAVQDPILGGIGRAANFKRSAEFHLLAPDGATARIYRINGIWPSMVDKGDYDMESAEAARVTVTFQVDSVYATDSAFGISLLNPLFNALRGVIG